MKRTCCTHKDAQFVCISNSCKQKCSYICSIPNDQCKQQHEACSLITLNYVTKKCTRIINKQKNLNVKELEKIYNLCRMVVGKLQGFFQEKQNALSVKNMLDTHGLLQPVQKQVLINFIQKDNNKNKSAQGSTQFSSSWLQKQLFNMNLQINTFLKTIKQNKQQIQQHEALRQQISSLKPQSRIIKKNTQNEKGSAIDKIRSQSKGPTPVKGSYIQQQKQSPVKNSRVTKVGIPGSSANGFQATISSVIKNHAPVGPLFSKITNDVQTIQTFFYQKFKGASLLYRASQNGFLASKFHQKCDGIANTLTIVITQYDKIIGGYTPLAWRSNGDWIEDQTQSSFIFNLTSGERYPLQNKSKAIWCSQTYGPSFGYPDLQIADKAFYNTNSCVNFPQYYNNGNYNTGSGSIQLLCGTKTGQFRIKQWEVYQLQF